MHELGPATEYVVTKSPVGLGDAAEIVGVFTIPALARAACRGAGTYLIAHCERNRAYKTGELLNVECVVIPTSGRNIL